MKSSEVLNAARLLLLDPKKWRQGNGNYHGDKLCAAQAIQRSASTYSEVIKARYYVGKALGADGWRDGALSEWNDVKGRLHSEIILLFDDAINLAIENERF